MADIIQVIGLETDEIIGISDGKHVSVVSEKSRIEWIFVRLCQNKGGSTTVVDAISNKKVKGGP